MSPRTSEPSVCNSLALRQAARHVSQIYDSHLAAVGLRSTQYSVLSNLQRLGPVTINTLAEAMVMDRTTLGRTIRPLERDGLLRVAPGQDGRTRDLHLTDAGLERLAQARAKWRDAQNAFEAAFGSDDAAAMRAMLRRVVVET